MIVSHNLRVLRAATPTLTALVRQGLLLPAPGEKAVEGASGHVYRPSRDLLTARRLHALDDLTFQLGEATIDCNAYALPPQEYAGLLRASPTFRQRNFAYLLPPLSGEMSPSEQREWVAALARAVQVEPVPDSTPHLLPTPPAVPAEWLPDQTRLVCTNCGWLLVLSFDVPDPVRRHVIKPSAVGIDVGLRTLAVGAHKSGLIHQARGIADIQITDADLDTLLPGRKDLHAVMRRLNVTVQHAAAREQLDQFLDLILCGATVVAFEKLRYDDMHAVFKRRARELGLRDFLASWLPQRLRQVGIYGVLVSPDLTSTLCNLTFRGGQRDPRNLGNLMNVNGDLLDADANAAANIRDLALSLLIHGNRDRTR